MPKAQCQHFSFRVDTHPVPGLAKPLQVPIYQCCVADTLRARLRSLADGEEIAMALEQTASDGTRHSIYGPDMEPLSTVTCTQERYHCRCEPAFIDLMTVMGLNAALPTTGEIDRSDNTDP
jgi:hypothetical protein